MEEKFLLSGIWNPELKSKAPSTEMHLGTSLSRNADQTLVDTLKLEPFDGYGALLMCRFMNEPGPWDPSYNRRRIPPKALKGDGSSTK